MVVFDGYVFMPNTKNFLVLVLYSEQKGLMSKVAQKQPTIFGELFPELYESVTVCCHGQI